MWEDLELEEMEMAEDEDDIEQWVHYNDKVDREGNIELHGDRSHEKMDSSDLNSKGELCWLKQRG